LSPVRLVLITPGMIGALMLGVFRLIRPSGSPAEAK
jgi:hypothetical protein